MSDQEFEALEADAGSSDLAPPLPPDAPPPDVAPPEGDAPPPEPAS